MDQLFQQQVSATDTILSRLRIYRDPNRVRTDVLTLLKNIPSLQPAVGALARGSPNQVFYLTGTVPIVYNGNQYNIPMNIWLIEAYPVSPPVVLVTPTQTMIIKPKHKHVDSSGMCYLPYISNWNPAQCNLLGLIQTVQATFAIDPPVRAAPTNQPTPSNPPQNVNPVPQGKAFENPSDVINRNITGQVTQKIQNKLQAFNQNSAKEINEANEKNIRLEQNLVKLDNDLKTIEQQKDNFDSDVSTLTSRFQELSNWLEKHEGKETIDIDAVTEPKDPLRIQLLDLVASDFTIEDTLYHLEKAFAKGDITADIFLKATRNLATEQFLKRALTNKIHESQKQKQ